MISAKSSIHRGSSMKRLIILCLSMMALSGCATPTQMVLDAEVKRLCAIDGGIKVYETVKLPSDKFDEYGQVNFYKPNQDENALGPEYQIKRDTTYFRKGNPEMSRTHIQLFRTSDHKLLGESIFYGRGGGDIPGPWYGTGLICPEISVKTDVLRQVFVIDRGN